MRNRGQIELYNQLRLAQFIDARTELLTANDLIDEASLDPYAFTRDAYLQRRETQILDGAPSKRNNLDDFEDAPVK